MKKTLLLFLVVFMLTTGGYQAQAAGAKGDKAAEPEALTATEQHLIHHRFVLIGVNGQEFKPGPEAANAPEIEFGEKMSLSGAMCNRFMGQPTLKDGILTASQMGMTMMMCPDPKLNNLDAQIGQMLEAGAQVTISPDGQILTLKDDTRSLVYKLQDRVK